jgi:nitrous oxidase accessory protein NosD
MRPTLLGARALVSGLLVLSLAPSVFGLSSRVFVSPLGKDSATCGAFASPCKTLAGAHTQAAPGGTVVVLYSGEFGPVTITKALTIEAPTGLTAMVQTSGAAITINAASSDVVSLRGLVLALSGPIHAGSGVLVNSAAAVHIERCVISGFGDAVAAFAWPSGKLFVTDTTARNNDQAIRATASPGPLDISIEGCVFESNNNGILVQDGTRTAVRGSVASGNIHGIIGQAGAGIVDLTVADCLVTHNSGYGVLSEVDAGGSAVVRVSGSTVTGNQTGLASMGSSAAMLSRGDNTVEGNTANTVGVGSYSGK